MNEYTYVSNICPVSFKKFAFNKCELSKTILRQKQEILVKSSLSQVRSLNEVNIYLKVCRNAAQILLVKPARSILKAVSLNITGLRGSLFLIEIHQHENVRLLLSLSYQLIDDWVGTCRNTYIASILRGDRRLHTAI